MTIKKKKVSFRFKGNLKHKGKDATTVNDYLKEAFPSGIIKAEKVVELAKNPNSPLHRYFDWDVKRSAHRDWLQQARQLIASIEVIYENQEPIRAYQHVVLEEEGNAYIDNTKASERQDLKDQIVEQARKELLCWKRRFIRLQEYFGKPQDAEGKAFKQIFKSIETLEE